MTPPPTLSPTRALLLSLLAVMTLAGCRPDTQTESGKPDGMKLYRLYCEGCHGPDGKKDGPERDLSRTRRMTDAEIRAVIRDGRGKMPPMKDYLKEEQISAILAHVRRLSPPSPAPQKVQP